VKRSIYFLMVLLVCTQTIFSLCTVYFRPRDDIKAKLIELINQERLSIDCAVYMFSEKTIADALLNAHVRGVKVRIVVDQISMGEKYGKGIYLRSNGIEVVVHAADSINAFLMPIMHHKFFIFGRNVETQKSLLWTGSYNCTASASRLHDENVIVVDDVGAIQQYKQCFEKLLQRLTVGRSIVDVDDECDLLEIETVASNVEQ